MLGKIFTWWNGATIGTLLHNWRHGGEVGSDSLGNRYFTDKRNDRRWVIYSGSNDASRVPPEWHGWLHHTHDALPDRMPPAVKGFEREAVANLTGTREAYRPAGSLDAGGKRQAGTGDYEAWSPDAP